jgi:flagellar hook-length control protein FliK
VTTDTPHPPAADTDAVSAPVSAAATSPAPLNSPATTAESAAAPAPAAIRQAALASVRDTVTPVATAPLASQNAPADAGTSKRESNSAASDRRDLEAVALRGASAPPSFQIAADIRSLLSTGNGPVVLSSPALQTLTGGTLSIRDGADIPQQIVSAMRLQSNNGVGDARIRLTPEYLGDVTISIRVERGQVTATLQASALETRQWIEGHESLLRQMLADRGLRLDEFVVSDEHASSEEESGANDNADHERPQPRRRASQGATFEVTA